MYLPQTCSFQSPVFLRCKIDEEVTHKAWLNRSNILFTGTDKWSLDSRVSLVNNNNSDFSIKIERVMVADEGPYTCSFQARNQPRTAHVYLIVQGMFSCLPPKSDVFASLMNAKIIAEIWMVSKTGFVLFQWFRIISDRKKCVHFVISISI